MLRKDGATAKKATKALEGMSVPDKNELLFRHGINFNGLPNWQKRGAGLYWVSYEKEGVNPQTGEKTKTVRRKVLVDLGLPMKEEYSAFIGGIVEGDGVTPSFDKLKV